jgi:hypothetical protein
MMPFPPAGLPFTPSLWIAARLMPLWAKRGALDDILRRATPAAGESAYRELPPGEIVGAVKAVVRRPWRMRGRRCLREGLLAFRYLTLAGYRPVLHFGLVAGTITTPRPRAHCWIVLDGKTILNPAQEPMIELFAYDGRAVPAGGAVVSRAAWS